jgi:hypothetical protein
MPLKLITGGGGSVILDANTTASNYTMYVPAENGSLLTSSSGLNASALSTGTVSGDRLPTIPRAKMPAGAILQVVSTTKTSTTSIAVGANQWNEFDGAFRVTIVPTTSSNKILITAWISGAQTTGTVRYKFQYTADNGSNWYDVDPIGNAVSNRSRGHFGYAINGDTNQVTTTGMEILHSPGTTNSLIYRILFGQDVATTYHFNRSVGYPDSFLGGTYTSSILAKEIAV